MFSVISQLVSNSYSYKGKLYLQTLNGFDDDWRSETSFDHASVRRNRQNVPFLDGNSQHKVTQLNHQEFRLPTGHRDLQQQKVGEQGHVPNRVSMSNLLRSNQKVGIARHGQNRFSRSNFLGSDSGFNWNNLQKSRFNNHNEESADTVYPSAPAVEADDRLIFDDDSFNFQNAKVSWSPQTTARTPKSTSPTSQFDTLDAGTTLPCERSCQVTSEYNPVCGSDGMTYYNKAKFYCARRCGKRELQNKSIGLNTCNGGGFLKI